jgi:phage tail protein X
VSNPQFVTHITSFGERWDLLAWNYYGDPTLFGPIVMANSGISIEPVFEAGLIVTIPVLQKTTVMIADLPPWKRAVS